DNGRLRIALSASLSGNMAEVIRYMRSYEFTCLEQRISRAAVAQDREELRKLAAEDFPAHMDGNGLLKYFPTSTAGNPALTSYVLYLARAIDWKLPKPTRE